MDDRPGDPTYTRSQKRVVNGQPSCECIVVKKDMLYDWSTFLLPTKNGEINKYNKQPEPKDYVSGPNKNNFKISETHYLEFAKTVWSMHAKN